MDASYREAYYEESKQGESIGKTILIVEDDELMGQFFIQTLRDEASYNIILAADAFRAMSIVRNIKPALFLLDYQLPHMNGIELYDRLHKASGLQDVPTLFVSAIPPIKELEKRHVYYMEKPFELDQFVQKIKELLSDAT